MERRRRRGREAEVEMCEWRGTGLVDAGFCGVGDEAEGEER